MKKVLIATVLNFTLILLNTLQSQQLSVFSQYTFNTFLLNPAAAGSEGYTTLNLISRRQWLGISGAPETDAITVQTRLYKRSFIEHNKSVKKRYVKPKNSGKVGLGFYMFCDRADILLNTGFKFTYAYHILTSKSQLSLGLSTGIYQLKIDQQKIRLGNDDDDLVNGLSKGTYYPDIDVGIYFTNRSIFCGVAANHLSAAHFQTGNSGFKYSQNRLISVMAGFQTKIKENTVMEPSLYLKSTITEGMQLDASLKFIFKGQYWIGLTWRTSKTIVGVTGFRINRFYLGYAIDYAFNGLSLASYGSHELMIAYKLGDNTRRYRWIERY